MKSKRDKRGSRNAKRKLLMQPLESRVVLAASLGWDGAGEGQAELTYYIANHPSSLTQAETEQAIETALDAWSSVANIKFTQTDQPGLKDSLDFSFSSIDGVSRTLAQSYYPDDVNSSRLAGDVQFDSAENWEVGNSEGSQAFDLTYVAVHEIGHALGLDHSNESGSVMDDYATTNTVFTGLSDSDIAEILELYAAASTDDSSSDSSSSDSDSTDSSDSSDSTDSSDTTETDTDTTPFPSQRWRHGGQWQGMGSRFGAGSSFIHNAYMPTDVNGDSRTSASDALTIINILNSDAVSLDLNNIGLVDTNGDTQVTPSDALIVINVLNGSNRSTVTIVMVSSVTDGTDDTSTDDSTTDSGSTDSESTDSGSDDSSSSDDGSSTDDGSSSDDTTSEDGSTTDDGSTDNGSTDDTTEDDTTTDDGTTDGEDCGVPSSQTGTGTQSRNGILAWVNADTLMTRYDADSSGTLTESEVPDRLWQLLVDSSTDADADSAVSTSELQTAITAARQDMFDAKDSDSDGQLTETEVGSRVWNKLSSADADSSDGVSFAEFDTWISENSGNNTLPGGHGHGHHGHGGMGHGMGHHGRGGHGAPELWQLAADSLFAEFDADSDGVLTSTELPGKILDDLLGKSVDSDSNGAISTDELKTAISTARETYFNATDADADGQLTETEVGSKKWRRISSADADSNGTVSLEEFQAWTPTKPSHDSASSTGSTIASGTSSTGSSLISRLMGRLVRR